MTWKDVTVYQYQQLAKVRADEILTDIDIAAKACAIMYCKTEREIDSLDLQTFNKMCAGLSFLSDEIPKVECAQYIDVLGRRYKCMYDVRKLKAGRYLESKAFGDDVIGNLHKIAASMVHPFKRNSFGRWSPGEYDAELHEDYATDMLSAPFITIYASVLFFCKVYAESMRVLSPYLKSQLPETERASMEEALNSLCSRLDGYTKQLSWRSMKALS